jgi:hypothetical protein
MHIESLTFKTTNEKFFNKSSQVLLEIAGYLKGEYKIYLDFNGIY